MKKICVVGTGYVGLVAGACFAELGNRVTCVDIDEAKVGMLREGIIPIFEPDLEPLVQRNMRARKLTATASFEEGVRGADFVFMCVGTPTTPQGRIDLSYLHVAYIKVNSVIGNEHPIIVNKSTVPPGTSDMMAFILARLANGKGAPAVVANPEFLREGHAVYDFMNPSRVVIGAKDPQAANAVAELYKPLNAPLLMTDTRTGELIKYASNAFLATKISFINEIATLCDSLGVDVNAVAEGMGLDPRIGKDFLRAGIGYGGSCFPKDAAVFTSMARAFGHEPKLLDAVVAVNAEQPLRLTQRLHRALGSLAGARVSVLGLTFKPHTDDIRSSPAIGVVKALQAEGAQVRAYDPQSTHNMRLLRDLVDCGKDPYEVARGADALVIATEWPEFKTLDLARLKEIMRGNVIADGRNLLDPNLVRQAGFVYIGMGRGSETSSLQSSGFANLVAADERAAV